MTFVRQHLCKSYPTTLPSLTHKLNSVPLHNKWVVIETSVCGHAHWGSPMVFAAQASRSNGLTSPQFRTLIHLLNISLSMQIMTSIILSRVQNMVRKCSFLDRCLVYFQLHGNSLHKYTQFSTNERFVRSNRTPRSMTSKARTVTELRYTTLILLDVTLY